MRVLEPAFFADRPLRVAPRLLGKVLVRRDAEGEIAVPITEVEAYGGRRDGASHAFRGRTPRNRPMYGPPGHWYVYFCYGVHWLLNVVTAPAGTPSALLLRGAGEIAGPARLTRHLDVDDRFDARPAVPETGLWIEDRGLAPRRGSVRRTPRVGIDGAGPPWTEKPWRFVVDPADLR